jgi:cytidylate kinase
MSVTGQTPRPVVTLAALYGAGATVIGPAVAERLGVPLLDREIPEAVARQSGVSVGAVAEVDQEPHTALGRLAATIGRAGTITGGAGGSEERLDLQERRLRGYIEAFLSRSSVDGCVAVGRGGMVVLRSLPWALHVYLGGPREARLEQRMRLKGIDRKTAEARLVAEDRARIGYVQRAYGVDGQDAANYHLMLDSTALELDDCVELIVAASRARVRHPRPSPPT